MQIVATFDPTAAPSGSFNSQSYDGCKLVIMNESRANIIFNFSNGQQSYVPANDKRAYSLTGIMSMPDPNISWTQNSLLTNGQTINQVTVELFQPSEELPEQYPSPVIRQTNIVGTLTASLLQLFGANPLTPVIEVGANANNLYAEMDAGGQLALNSGANFLSPTLQIVPYPTNLVSSGVGQAIINEFLGPVGFVNVGGNPLRLIIIDFNGWKNGASTVSYTTQNGGFTRQTLILSGDAAGHGFKLGSGPLLTTQILTALASPSGTTTGSTDPQKNNIVFIESAPWDTIVFDANNGTTHNGAMFIIGY